MAFDTVLHNLLIVVVFMNVGDVFFLGGVGAIADNYKYGPYAALLLKQRYWGSVHPFLFPAVSQLYAVYFPCRPTFCYFHHHHDQKRETRNEPNGGCDVHRTPPCYSSRLLAAMAFPMHHFTYADPGVHLYAALFSPKEECANRWDACTMRNSGQV